METKTGKETKKVARIKSVEEGKNIIEKSINIDDIKFIYDFSDVSFGPIKF